MLVERVERLAREDEREAEERRGDEAGAEIRDSRRDRQSSADDRPPEDESARDQQRMLDVERPARVEGPCVEAGEVRAVPREEPRDDCVARADVARAVAA